MRACTIDQFITGSNVFHLHRATVVWARFDSGHTHDYSEVFWVETGELLHRINGADSRMLPGDVCWVTSDDWHAFRAREKTTIINLLFEDDILTNLESRYFSSGQVAPWKLSRDHPANSLSESQLKTFNRKASQLAFAPQTLLSLECFLLELIQTLTAQSYPNLLYDEYPQWLGEAIREFVSRDLWSISHKDFASLAGRSPEHISRTIRNSSGLTTSELLNSLRLEKAAADLCMTTKSISDIAMDVGFENVGYFYKLFRQRFGLSPRRFRIERQALILKR